MHRASILIVALGIFVCSSLAMAEGGKSLSVSRAVMCTGLEGREPMNPGTTFPSTVGQLFCFTEVLGAVEPTTITHVWYFKEMERHRFSLQVQGEKWRTRSFKTIQPAEVGDWRVEVLDAAGQVLTKVLFTITK